MSLTVEGIVSGLQKLSTDITSSLASGLLGLDTNMANRLTLISLRYGISVPSLVGIIVEGWLASHPPESAEQAPPSQLVPEVDRATLTVLTRRFPALSPTQVYGEPKLEAMGRLAEYDYGMGLARKQAVQI